MKFIKAILCCCVFSLLTTVSYSQNQVIGIKYYMEYDDTECLYDCGIIITEGSATAIPFRTQFNSNYTVVTPTQSTVTIVDNYLPIENNQWYTGDTPAEWVIGSSAFDVFGSGYDYHPIGPSLSPAAQYNDIVEGDTLILFSLRVEGNNQCGKGVRFFENGVDQNTNGGDFSCGFTLGGPIEDFQGLEPVVYPLALEIPEPVVDMQNGISIDLDATPTACQSFFLYEWSGPNGYTSTEEDVLINTITEANYGTYTVIVQDSIECKDTIDVLVLDPNAIIVGESTIEGVLINPTFENIAVHVNISGDDNKNSELTIEYKLAGTNVYLPGAMTMRATSDIIVDGSALDMNFHAGSAMNLLPNSEYDIRITLTDEDGGTETIEQTVKTKQFPQPNSTGQIIHVIPGSGGGDGTAANPFRGLQYAVDNVVQGDILEVADGVYEPFTITTSGTAENPITIRSTNLHGAVINGGNTNTGVVTIGSALDSIGHIVLDGFEVTNGAWGIDAQNTQYLTVKNNKINDVNFGFYNRRENGWEHDQYVTNNEIVGRTNWPQLNGNIPGERGIDIRGNKNVISHNSISDFGDGISTDGPASQNSYALDIHENYITRIVDDIIEVDGTISNTRVYKNQGLNGRTGVSLAPIYGGPAYIFRNEFYNLENSAIKMNNGTAGLIIVNNSIAKENRGITSPAGWQNTVFKNNAVLSGHYVFEEFDLMENSVDEWGNNAYYSLRAGTSAEPWFKWNGVQYQSINDLVNDGQTEINSVVTEYSDFVDIEIPFSYGTEALVSDFDYYLASGSSLINAGVSFDNIFEGDVTDGQIDIGALEAGKPVPDYGVDFSNVCDRISLSTRTWNGSQNIGWFHPYNWTPCGVPEKITTVTIPTVSAEYPFLNTDAEVGNLNLLGLGKLEITNESIMSLKGTE